MSKRTLTSIDVGTTKVCTTIAEVSEGGVYRVAGVGLTPSNGLHKGLVVNINEAKEAIRESVRKAEKASGYKVESAYVGVTGRHVTSLHTHGLVAITRNDRLVKPDDLKRVLQCAQSVKVPNDRKLLHIIPRHYSVDGQAGVKNPVGMHGFRLDVETHVITAAVSSIQNLAKCIRGIGVDIHDLVLEPLASSEAVLTEDEKQSAIILADIGGGTTDVAIFKDGSIWHTAILPVAGYQLTRDVAIGLGLPFEVAEQMKKRYGTVMPYFDESEETPRMVGENGHGVSHRDLSDIIRARVEEIIRLSVLELPRQDLEELVLAYAISIHKSQGSEYPVVVMPILMTHFVMLQRNLIYTGITRAKKLLVLIGSRKALSYAIRNNNVLSRNTRLAERLRGIVLRRIY
jgi:cell division protein FtsA